MARNTSIVVDPVPAVLPTEVTKTIRHINNNRERERERERDRERDREREREREREIERDRERERERENFIEINRTCTNKNYNGGFGLIQGDLC